MAATKVTYEWTLETIDRETGDILESDFSSSLTFENYDPEKHDLGLVRDAVSEANGIEYRLWAYVRYGSLPVYFSDSVLVTHFKVPLKYSKELEKFLKKIKK